MNSSKNRNIYSTHNKLSNKSKSARNQSQEAEIIARKDRVKNMLSKQIFQEIKTKDWCIKNVSSKRARYLCIM